MVRQLMALIVFALAESLLAAVSGASAQQRDISRDFESCKAIEAEQARLDCFKGLISKDSSGPSAAEQKPSTDHWPLVRTSRPSGGPDAVAIMRTADTSRSDPDLAGLMIRCKEKPDSGFEVILALVRPFPPRSKKDVVIAAGTTRSVLHAEIAAPGTALVLPIDATAFVSGPWRGRKELAVDVNDPDGDIRGVIGLDGIAAAMAKLSASCPSR